MKAVKLRPYCAKAIWGGNKLREKYGKKADFDIAESWELSGYPGKESCVDGGIHDGKTITELIEAEGKQILGTKAANAEKFPILIKFIDAVQPLSIQVHPDDAKAELLGAYGGKTEMWIVCEADEGAFLYYGVNEALDQETFAASVEDGSITDKLNRIAVKPGDTFFIEAGTIHAIGAGITICEIQQSSDTTYRLYDYKRTDANGNQRELHIEKGKIASNLTPPDHFYEIGEKKGDENVLVTCPFFTTSIIDVNGMAETSVTSESFSTVTVTDGVGTIELDSEYFEVKKGDTVMLFASAGNVMFKGKMTVVKATL